MIYINGVEVKPFMVIDGEVSPTDLSPRPEGARASVSESVRRDRRNMEHKQPLS